jgi:hypothetical protein
MDKGTSKDSTIKLDVTVSRTFASGKADRDYAYTASLGTLSAHGATETQARERLAGQLQAVLGKPLPAPEFARDDDGATVALIPDPFAGGHTVYRVTNDDVFNGGTCEGTPAEHIERVWHWKLIPHRCGH